MFLPRLTIVGFSKTLAAPPPARPLVFWPHAYTLLDEVGWWDWNKDKRYLAPMSYRHAYTRARTAGHARYENRFLVKNVVPYVCAYPHVSTNIMVQDLASWYWESAGAMAIDAMGESPKSTNLASSTSFQPLKPISYTRPLTDRATARLDSLVYAPLCQLCLTVCGLN